MVLVEVRRSRAEQAAQAPAAAPVAGRQGRGAARFEVVDPPQRRGRVFELGEEVTVGRSPGCAVPLEDDTFASSIHARVFRRSGELWLEDLGSTNGTWLNDERLDAPVRLQRGDRVKIGSTILEVARESSSACGPAAATHTGYVRIHQPGPRPRERRPRGGRRRDGRAPRRRGRRPIGRRGAAGGLRAATGRQTDCIAAVRGRQRGGLAPQPVRPQRCTGMGTTLTAAAPSSATSSDGQAAPRPRQRRRLAGLPRSTGDERSVHQLTEDHSVVEEMVRSGELTPRRSRRPPPPPHPDAGARDRGRDRARQLGARPRARQPAPALQRRAHERARRAEIAEVLAGRGRISTRRRASSSGGAPPRRHGQRHRRRARRSRRRAAGGKRRGDRAAGGRAGLGGIAGGGVSPPARSRSPRRSPCCRARAPEPAPRAEQAGLRRQAEREPVAAGTPPDPTAATLETAQMPVADERREWRTRRPLLLVPKEKREGTAAGPDRDVPRRPLRAPVRAVLGGRRAWWSGTTRLVTSSVSITARWRSSRGVPAACCGSSRRSWRGRGSRRPACSLLIFPTCGKA